jgi:hypothetical protein
MDVDTRFLAPRGSHAHARLRSNTRGRNDGIRKELAAGVKPFMGPLAHFDNSQRLICSNKSYVSLASPTKWTELSTRGLRSRPRRQGEASSLRLGASFPLSDWMEADATKSQFHAWGDNGPLRRVAHCRPDRVLGGRRSGACFLA